MSTRFLYFLLLLCLLPSANILAAFTISKNTASQAIAASSNTVNRGRQIVKEHTHGPKKKRFRLFDLDNYTPKHPGLLAALSLALGLVSFTFFTAVWESIPNVQLNFGVSCVMALTGLLFGNLAMNGDDHLAYGMGFTGILICALFLAPIVGGLIFSAFFHYLLGV